jgi:hypothetical protein
MYHLWKFLCKVGLESVYLVGEGWRKSKGWGGWGKVSVVCVCVSGWGDICMWDECVTVCMCVRVIAKKCMCGEGEGEYVCEER